MKTTYEKIFKRDNGTQFKIDASIITFHYEFQYRINIAYRDKGKKNWLYLPDTLHDYEFRRLSMEDRENHKNENYLRFVTPDEILQAKIGLWNQLKPAL